jgi:hypothetical protein
MTGNAKSEALELHELSSEDLDAVSGGDKNTQFAEAQAQQEAKDRAAAKELMTAKELIAQ